MKIKIWKDSAGREWQVKCDVVTLGRCESYGIDFANLFTSKATQRKLSKPPQVYALFKALCYREIEKRKLDDEALVEVFDRAGCLAFLDTAIEALIEFFPPELQDVARRVRKATADVMPLLRQEWMAVLATVEDKLAKLVTTQSTGENSSGSSAA